ncbi:MAG TPA: S-methyl-5-thioribose-1-phosphate isomerase [Bacteroidetes bacterium]|nr:S-methyl-5-thioribose-1-phosphate isomerase [Bacteroidota bacterium]
MKIGDKHYRSLWLGEGETPQIRYIDQAVLPFRFETGTMNTPKDALVAITEMKVRGAPLIGAVAAGGIFLAAYRSAGENHQEETVREWAGKLKQARPTAVNLRVMVNRMMDRFLDASSPEEPEERARKEFMNILEEETEACRLIGLNGLEILKDIHRKTGRTVNILTHCNAGWLACIDYGTATAPIYLAHERHIPVHVWVDETRPRNQGARLTAWELQQAGIPHTVITDNAGGYLMQKGRVDVVLVGSDRTTRNGDVANKIGTYLKALAARDNGIPFYVALPVSSIDREMGNGVRNIPVEERSGEEVRLVEGLDGEKRVRVRILPEEHLVANPGFDVTPARLVTALITERGVCMATEEGIASLFHDT